MKLYAVHTKLVETQDLLDMLEIYPSPASYGDFYLFAQPHPDAQQDIVDLSPIEDMDIFNAAYLDLLTQEHTGRWIHLSTEQGRFLKSMYFTPEEPPVEEELSVTEDTE